MSLSFPKILSIQIVLKLGFLQMRMYQLYFEYYLMCCLYIYWHLKKQIKFLIQHHMSIFFFRLEKLGAIRTTESTIYILKFKITKI